MLGCLLEHIVFIGSCQPPPMDQSGEGPPSEQFYFKYRVECVIMEFSSLNNTEFRAMIETALTTYTPPGFVTEPFIIEC